MKTKHKFTPDQVVPMEERALLSHFPVGLGPVTTLHYKGAFVLTSGTFNKLQSQINTAILNFEQSVIRLFNHQGGFTAAFDSAVGDGTLGIVPPSPNNWSYAPGTLLAKLDKAMGSLEFKVPGGAAFTPSIGGGGGVGLTNRTNLSTLNPGEPVDPVSGFTDSVAELLETAITTQEASTSPTAITLRTSMDLARMAALGIVPSYIVAYGPQGAGEFGLKN